MRPQKINYIISTFNSRRQPENEAEKRWKCYFFLQFSLFNLTIYFNICFSTICYLSMNIAEFAQAQKYKYEIVRIYKFIFKQKQGKLSVHQAI